MSRRNISCIAQDEPSFIKRFKQSSGFKEGPDINTKRQVQPPTFDDDDDDGDDVRDDEKPVVVVLKRGDLSQAEVEKEENITKSEGKQEDEDGGGKLVFKKPTKRTDEKESELSVSTSKKKKEKHIDKDKKKKVKEIKNSKLLSFDDEDEES